MFVRGVADASPAHACVQRSVVVPARPQESEARTPLAWVQGELCAVILDDQTVRRKRRPSPAAVIVGASQAPLTSRGCGWCGSRHAWR